MLVPLTTVVIAVAVLLALIAAIYLVIDRIVDDALLLTTATLEVLLIVLAVVSVVVHGQVRETSEGATLMAYALTLPIVPPVVVFLALKEKTRWTMGVLIAGALTVAVMAYRILQIWWTGV